MRFGWFRSELGGIGVGRGYIRTATSGTMAQALLQMEELLFFRLKVPAFQMTALTRRAQYVWTLTYIMRELQEQSQLLTVTTPHASTSAPIFPR